MSVATKKPAVSYQASWHDMVVINFDIEPRIVEMHLPPGLEVDLYNDHSFISLVALKCRDTVIKGIRIPFHSNYAQLQLRCYVKRTDGDTTRRGTFFIKRFVPSRRVARLMSWWTGQKYQHMRIRTHVSGFQETDPNIMPEAQYECFVNGRWNKIKIKARSQRRKLRPESKDQFILDHQYAYYSDGKNTFEYLVDHPPWLIWDAASGALDCDVEALFGKEFARPMKHRPSSVMLARGSDVTVYQSTKIA